MLLPKSYAATVSVVPPIDVLQKESSWPAAGCGKKRYAATRRWMSAASLICTLVSCEAEALPMLLSKDLIWRRFTKFRRAIPPSGRFCESRTSIKVGDEGIVTITVEDRDPCQAANLANAYVEELDRQNKRLFVGQATNKKVFLENRLKEMEQELSRIDNLLSRDAKIKEMLFELLTREYEIAKIEEAKSMPTIQVLDRADCS